MLCTSNCSMPAMATNWTVSCFAAVRTLPSQLSLWYLRRVADAWQPWIRSNTDTSRSHQVAYVNRRSLSSPCNLLATDAHSGRVKLYAFVRRRPNDYELPQVARPKPVVIGGKVTSGSGLVTAEGRMAGAQCAVTSRPGSAGRIDAPMKQATLREVQPRWRRAYREGSLADGTFHIPETCHLAAAAAPQPSQLTSLHLSLTRPLQPR